MFLALILVVLVVLIILYIVRTRFQHQVPVRSMVDKRTYNVLDLPDKEVAADQLAKLRIKLERFIGHLDKKRHSPKVIARLRYRFKAVLSESKQGPNITSYTINKGSKISMCIRERDENNKLIDENTLFFVALHELAHIMTISIGHTEEFWQNFRFLLKHAIKGKYYIYQPYHRTPKKYCGVQISDTPYKL